MQTATRRMQRTPRREPPPHRPLDELLGDMVSAHESLAHAASAQREAMRDADPLAMSAAREQMSAACARIAALHEERVAIVRSIAPGRPDATFSTLAAAMAEPARSRALELADRLRELVANAREEQRRLHAATDLMLRHVRGMVQHIQRSLNHAGIYGRAGRVEPGASVVSGIDLTR